jgi:Nucleotidyltransferase of unknown function (DUF6036)
VKELAEEALRLQQFCEAKGWRFCFIGGIAVQRWSEPRLTNDSDMTLLTGFGGEAPFVDALLAEYRPRLKDARTFALTNRVLLLHGHNGSGLDIALGALPFEEEAIARSKYEEYLPGLNLRVCSAEDLIVMKVFANRELDWRDVKMTIVRQGSDTLDWEHIYKHLTPLLELKDEMHLLSKLDELRRRGGQS